MIVWIDTETTGLNPLEDALLEIAVVVTDDQLNEVRRWQTVLPSPASTQIVRMLAHGVSVDVISQSAGVDPYVIAMHDKNGLWAESCSLDPFGDDWRDRHTEAERVLKDIITAATETVNGKPSPPQLGGSSVWFDRTFLEADFPEAVKLLHHRQVDVSTMNEMARRFWPATYARRPRGGDVHRAMPDILQSLELARYYANHLQAVAP